MFHCFKKVVYSLELNGGPPSVEFSMGTPNVVMYLRNVLHIDLALDMSDETTSVQPENLSAYIRY